MAKTFIVDIPDYKSDGSWIFVESFPTRKEALAFCKEAYGADRNGKIQLISELDEGDDNDIA